MEDLPVESMSHMEGETHPSRFAGFETFLPAEFIPTQYPLGFADVCLAVHTKFSCCFPSDVISDIISKGKLGISGIGRNLIL